MILIGGKAYELITDHKNGWNQEVFKERYSEVLDRYDYVVGDWGYNQMRLRGFFKENNPKATKESSIACLQDYLNEYCNFGCAYFILERIPGKNTGTGDGGDFADEASLREETTAAQEDMPRYTIRSQPAQERGGRPQQSPVGGQGDKQGTSGVQGGQQGAGQAQGQQGPKQHKQGGHQGPQGQSGQLGQRPQRDKHDGRPQGQYQQGGRQGQQPNANRNQGGPNQQHGPRAHVSAQNQGQGGQQGQGQAQKQHGSQGNRQGQRPQGQGGFNQQRGSGGNPSNKQPAPNATGRDG